MRREYRAGPHIRRSKIRPSERLLAYALRLGLARPDAEDLVQELYVRLLRPTDEPIRDWFSYRFAHLQKLAANARRRERRRVRLLEQRPLVAHVDLTHEDWLLTRFTAERIVDWLPHADAELLRWRFVEDRSIAAIAEQLHIPEGTVKSRLHGALKRARVVVGIERPR